MKPSHSNRRLPFMNLYQFIHTIHQPLILQSSLLSRKWKKRDCCSCSMKLRNKDLLKEFMDKVFGKALLSLPGKVSLFGMQHYALFAIRKYFSFLAYECFFLIWRKERNICYIYICFSRSVPSSSPFISINSNATKNHQFWLTKYELCERVCRGFQSSVLSWSRLDKIKSLLRHG